MVEKKTSTFRKSKITGKWILAKGSESAREYLDKLSDKQKTHVVLTASPEQRVHLLSLMEYSPRVIRSLPEEELYWTIKEVGARKCLSLLKYSSADQTHFVFDIEWWEGDTLNRDRIFNWLKMLVGCGENKIIQWLKTFDYDLLVLTLKLFLRISKPDEGTATDYGEAVEELPPLTYDGIYFIRFLTKNTEQIMNRILTVLISSDSKLFRNLMESIIWSDQRELEYEAFYNTQSRLEEKGIPEYDEARSVYRIITQEEIAGLPKREKILITRPAKSFYPILVGSKKRLFLTRVLEQIENYAVLEDLSLHLARVANKVLIADHFAVSNHASFKAKLAKTTGFINIGLETVSECDEIRGVSELQIRWLEQLFQIGWGRVVELKKNIQVPYTFFIEKFPGGLDSLDFPLRETFLGLTKEKPQFFAGIQEDDYQNYHDFQSLAEIELTQDRIRQALFLGELIYRRLALLPQLAKDMQGAPVEPEPVTLSTIFMTSYAQKVLTDSWTFTPLNFTALTMFLDTLFGDQLELAGNSLVDHKNEMVRTVEKTLSDSFSDIELTYLDRFSEECLLRLSKEYTEARSGSFLDIIVFKTLKVEHFNEY